MSSSMVGTKNETKMSKMFIIARELKRLMRDS